MAGSESLFAEMGGKVLVVDDEEYVRTILSDAIGEMGLEAIPASDGDSGLAAFESCPSEFVACVVDLTMPGMSGIELLAELRTLDASVPVLLVSGYQRHEIKQQESQSRNVRFLQKPFTMDSFRETLSDQMKVA